MRSCGPARSSSSPSTVVVSKARIPSAPSTASESVNESASASWTRSGTGPVTCTVGGTLGRERDAQLAQPRIRRRAREEEHARVVLASAERRVRREHGEAQLAARAVRVRDGRDPPVERERDPRAVAQVREVTDQRRRYERRTLRQRAQQLAADLVDNSLLVELLGDVQ